MHELVRVKLNMLIFVILSIISVIVIILVLLHLRMRWKYRSLNGIPGPTNHILFGAALKYCLNPYELFDIFKTYKSSSVKGQLGPVNMYLITIDPELVKFFLSSSKFITKSRDYNMARVVFGNGLILSTESYWKNQRKIINPAFHLNILKEFIPNFNAPLEILMELLSEHIDEKEFDIYPYLSTCALDMICETVMGTSVKAQSNTHHPYVMAIKRVYQTLLKRGLSPWKHFDFLFKFFPEYKSLMEDIKQLHDFSRTVIRKRRLQLLERPHKDDKTQDDLGIKKHSPFLDLLLQAKIDGKLLNDDEINDEVNTFMIAGHDTTSTSASFALYELSRHPYIQAKAFQELTEIFGDNKEVCPTLQDLNNMNYLELIIKETLRLYPPAPIFLRVLEEDVLLNKILYPKDLAVAFSPFHMQRCPDLFENPEEFEPQRFLPENSISRHPYSYIPFSAGPRNCIGHKFAIYKLKAILSKVLLHFELLPADPKYEAIVAPLIILKSANGLHLRLKKR